MNLNVIQSAAQPYANANAASDMLQNGTQSASNFINRAVNWIGKLPEHMRNDRYVAFAVFSVANLAIIGIVNLLANQVWKAVDEPGETAFKHNLKRVAIDVILVGGLTLGANIALCKLTGYELNKTLLFFFTVAAVALRTLVIEIKNRMNDTTFIPEIYPEVTPKPAEETKGKGEEESKAAEAAAKKKADEEKVAAEAEAKKKADEEKVAAEAQAKKKAEEEAKVAEEAAAKKKTEEEAKAAADAAAKKKAEEEAKAAADAAAKKKAEQEAKATAEAEAKKKAEEEAKATAEAAAKKKADEEKVAAEATAAAAPEASKGTTEPVTVLVETTATKPPVSPTTTTVASAAEDSEEEESESVVKTIFGWFSPGKTKAKK